MLYGEVWREAFIKTEIKMWEFYFKVRSLLPTVMIATIIMGRE